ERRDRLQDEVLAGVGTAFELPQGGQLELAGRVGRRNAHNGATIVQRALEDSAIDLGGLGTVRLLAIGGVVGGNLYDVLRLRWALKGATGRRFGCAAGRSHALDAKEHFQQIFLSLAQLLGAGVSIGSGLSIPGLGDAL